MHIRHERLSKKFRNGLILDNAPEAPLFQVGWWRRAMERSLANGLRWHRANSKRRVTVYVDHTGWRLILPEAHKADFSLKWLSCLEWSLQHRVFSCLRNATELRLFLSWIIFLLVKEHVSWARTILLHANLTERVSRAKFTTHNFRVVSWGDCWTIRAGAWHGKTWHFVRNSWLVQKLLLWVRPKGHLAIIEALFLDLLIRCVVVCSGFGAIGWGIKPLLWTFLTSLHDVFRSIFGVKNKRIVNILIWYIIIN